MSTEKEFGFIITQGITRKMTKAKVTEKLTDFLAKRKQELMKKLKLQENRIHTSSYYDKDSQEYKGLLRIKKECKDSRIEQIQDWSKVIWAAKDCQPYTIVIYKNY
jgi:hypothetical protein